MAWYVDLRDKTWEAEDVEVKAVGAKAFLIEFEEGREEWIPFSQIRQGTELDDVGDRGRLVCTRWIAEKKGLA